MSRIVRSELLKLRTTRTALGFAAAGVLLVLLVVIVGILAGDPSNIPDKRSTLAVGNAIGPVLMLFGIVGATAEYRHRTAATAALVVPQRLRLTTGRMLAFGLAGLLVGALLLVVAMVIGIPLLGGTRGPSLAFSDYARIVGGGLLTCSLAAMLGVGIGVLIANQVAAVVGALVWLFIAEPSIGIASRTVREYLIGDSFSALGGASGRHLLSFGVALLVVGGWTVGALAVAALVDSRRDIG